MPNRTLNKAIADYAELDMEVGRLISGRLAPVCAACPKPCCRPDVCRQAVESWWLRHVTQHVHGKWWPDDWQTRDACIAMTGSGCMLQAGRPVICRSFVCDRYTEAYRDIWEVLFYSFLSDLAWEVGQLSSRLHLETITAAQAARHARQIAQRIAAGREQLELARRLVAPDTAEVEKHRVALRLLAVAPRFWRATTRRSLLARLDGGAGCG